MSKNNHLWMAMYMGVMVIGVAGVLAYLYWFAREAGDVEEAVNVSAPVLSTEGGEPAGAVAARDSDATAAPVEEDVMLLTPVEGLASSDDEMPLEKMKLVKQPIQVQDSGKEKMRQIVEAGRIYRIDSVGEQGGMEIRSIGPATEKAGGKTAFPPLPKLKPVVKRRAADVGPLPKSD